MFLRAKTIFHSHHVDLGNLGPSFHDLKILSLKGSLCNHDYLSWGRTGTCLCKSDISYFLSNFRPKLAVICAKWEKNHFSSKLCYCLYSCGSNNTNIWCCEKATPSIGNIRVEWLLRRKTGTQQVVPDCYMNPISKFHFEMYFFNLAHAWPQKFLTVTLTGKNWKLFWSLCQGRMSSLVIRTGYYNTGKHQLYQLTNSWKG